MPNYTILKQKIKDDNISISIISSFIGIPKNSLIDKLNGKSSFYFDEAVKIRDIFFPDSSLQELFKKETKII